MATMAADPVFVDTNILVYAAIPSAPFHGPAFDNDALPLTSGALPSTVSRGLPLPRALRINSNVAK
jgi:hypothetical protein